MNWWLAWIQDEDGSCREPVVVAAKYPDMAVMEMPNIEDGQVMNVLNVPFVIHEHPGQDPVKQWNHQEWLDFMDQQRRKFPDKYEQLRMRFD